MKTFNLKTIFEKTKNPIYSIYLIINYEKNCFYVGRSENLKQRMKAHFLNFSTTSFAYKADLYGSIDRHKSISHTKVFILTETKSYTKSVDLEYEFIAMLREMSRLKKIKMKCLNTSGAIFMESWWTKKQINKYLALFK